VTEPTSGSVTGHQPLSTLPPTRLRGLTSEQLAYLLVFAVALTLRLVALDDKPLHHDESVHAWFTWRLVTGRGYEYDPVYHGPVQYYLDALGYLAVGVGRTGVRLFPAIAGAVLTVLPYALRHQLGRTAALTAAVIFCISPSFVYFSRFAREDSYTVLLTFAIVVVAFRFLDRPQRWQPAVMLALIAASLATKETTYITGFVWFTFLVVVLVVQWRRPDAVGPSVLAAVTSVGRKAWLWAGAAFAAVYMLLFTTFLAHPAGLRTALVDSWGYWLSQQPVNRGGQPWFYYLVVLPLYELPVLLLAVVGVVAAVRRPTLLRLYLVWSAALGLAIFSWASERMPWLVVHILLPIVLLAGIGMQTLWTGRRAARTAAVAIAAAGAAFLGWGMVHVAYVHPADPGEMLVFTQTSTASDEMLETILRAQPASVQLDSTDGTAWPWAFTLRDVPVEYVEMSGGFTPDADLVVVGDDNLPFVPLPGYTGTRFPLREWWVVDWAGVTPVNALRWFVTREPWSPRGSLDQWLFVRAGAG
jgi:uncharacterized protein (TIGR03663 family)